MKLAAIIITSFVLSGLLLAGVYFYLDKQLTELSTIPEAPAKEKIIGPEKETPPLIEEGLPEEEEEIIPEEIVHIEEEILDKLSMEERVGQLFIIGFEGTTLNSEIKDLFKVVHPGGVILFSRNIQDANQLNKLIKDLQNLSLEESGLPLFVAIDQEGGSVRRIQWIEDEISQGEIKDNDQAYQTGLKRGYELKKLGINLNLAPVLDITKKGDFLHNRSFQMSPETTGELSKNLILGQKDSGILTTIKHFPGYGGISFNPETVKIPTVPQIPEVSQFQKAIEAKPELIMTANVIYSEIDEKLPFTFSLKGIEFLKEKIKGDYIIISDDLSSNALKEGFSLENSITLAQKAGVDILLVAGWSHAHQDQFNAFNTLLKAARQKQVDEKQINDSALKVIRLKQKISETSIDREKQAETEPIVLISGNTFLMGDSNGFDDEQPAHTVTIKTFYMDETPVTYTDFQKYIDAGGTETRYWNYETYNQPEHPVTGLDWYHAIDYCNWRSKIEGLLPAYKPINKLDAWGYLLWELDASMDGYRLPSEAEFEYAARGGLEEKQFPWGNEFDPSFANYDNERGLMRGEWWRLAKVKDTLPNDYGLYGMSGNIWHWTNDWYDPNYYAKSVENNPMGPESNGTKVLRGGSWGSISPDYLRTAKRSYMAPSNYNYDVGFRCVRPVAGEIEDSKLTQNISEQEIVHTFYQYGTSHYENPIQINLYGEEFVNSLSQFIADYYPNSIYFQTKIDEQEIITSREMAELIVEVTRKYSIHPLFLTGIIAAESGFGTCSFPRWYNNPMAYHWQNILMKNGLPTYTASSYRNRKYKDLEAGFIAFADGIRKNVYFNAAQNDLDAFHLIYVGYRADEWMYTISRIYKDVLGIRLEPDFPTKNVGELIYTDWYEL